MAKVELKQPVVDEIKELFDGAETAVVVDYRGLTVAQDTELRKKLREAGVVYKVYKNTMIRFAGKGTAFEALEPKRRAWLRFPAFLPEKFFSESYLEASSLRSPTLPACSSRSQKRRAAKAQKRNFLKEDKRSAA